LRRGEPLSLKGWVLHPSKVAMMVDDNVVQFPKNQDPPVDYIFAEEIELRSARTNLAAAIAMLQKPRDEQDLDKVLHLINEAWGVVAGVHIMRFEV